MKTINSIRLLGNTNNERGDLFTRLTKDLFFALGYGELRLDIHKTGREIDIQGNHRLEKRVIIGECKAHAKKMGGAELNKFYGVLAREREKSNQIPVTGYFVSLGGFTQSGVEQEAASALNGSILLDAEKVISELEKCRVLVGPTIAAEKSGHCVNHSGLKNIVIDSIELVGHHLGYVYILIYSEGKHPKYFSLIHADGTILDKSLAIEIAEADKKNGGNLHNLEYLTPPTTNSSKSSLEPVVLERYKTWLGEECGFIHLDGLPADSDLSATRLKLEKLFVPLKCRVFKSDDEITQKKDVVSDKNISIGKVIEETPHLAILAMPGGGKSTLIKRLATAYAFPERKAEVNDDLPNKEWLPIILKCRELKDKAHRPIIELLNDIPKHASMNAEESLVFNKIIHDGLKSGKTLLLIDGLDEISEEGARQSFANHLRTFIAMFPETAVIITSRQAGFRLVAGVVASACKQATLSPLDETDVTNLCEKWHVEVVSDSEKVRRDAIVLAKEIWGNTRIRTLTENPLLFTTLLVVKRVVQELPKNRASLYREAIRVLVRTWNVEGYAPLVEDEALAQLSYIACSMMEQGKQQISQKSLLELLKKARQELDVELQFSKISPQEFIERIEYRSSLLMQVGHDKIDGELQPIYEFRHLTFQEYLAARGYVEEQYSGRDEGKTLADILERYFDNEAWQEVIPTAAVLAGRKSEQLIQKIIANYQTSSKIKNEQSKHKADLLCILLSQCILDEVTITASTLRIALNELAIDDGYKDGELTIRQRVPKIISGKFGLIMKEIIEEKYLSSEDGFEQYLSSMEACATNEYSLKRGEFNQDTIEKLNRDLDSKEDKDNIKAALICMGLAFSLSGTPDKDASERKLLEPLSNKLIHMVINKDYPSQLAATWALAWFGTRRLLKKPSKELILSFFKLWKHLNHKYHAHFPAWSLSAQVLLDRNVFQEDDWGEDCDQFLINSQEEIVEKVSGVKSGAIVVGWYRKSPWKNSELVELLKTKLNKRAQLIGPTDRQLLKNLGESGKKALIELDEQKRKI